MSLVSVGSSEGYFPGHTADCNSHHHLASAGCPVAAATAAEAPTAAGAAVLEAAGRGYWVE